MKCMVPLVGRILMMSCQDSSTLLIQVNTNLRISVKVLC